MTEPDTTTYEEMKSYLFHELSEEEREALEDRFFSDDALFYELTDLENELVDQYARGELKGKELNRFERSLEKVPERRRKISNAVALQSFIEEEKKPAETPVVAAAESTPTLWEKIAAFFTFQMPAMQYASAALILLLAAGTSYLLYERFRLNQELANYRETQNSQIKELEKQEQLLQDKLKEIGTREEDLQKQLTNQNGQTEILNQQIEEERSKRLRLENELKQLRQQQKDLPQVPQKRNQPPKPQIATVLLTPFSGTRGGGDSAIKNVKLAGNTSRLTATLQIPKESTGQSFTVRFAGQTLATNRKARTTKSGYKFITVSLSAKQISADKDNVISVTDEEGNRYNFVFRSVK